MESDIYGNTALPLAPDLQSLQTPHITQLNTKFSVIPLYQSLFL